MQILNFKKFILQSILPAQFSANREEEELETQLRILIISEKTSSLDTTEKKDPEIAFIAMTYQ